MMILRYTSSAKLRLTFFALLTVITLLMPLGAKAAERDGTVLFFPLEDIQQVFIHPSFSSLISLFSFSPPTSSFAWSETAEQYGLRERNAFYGVGPEIEGHHLPGPRPLWGY
jgi:hypothetical protein